jgi:hypothetical protein
VIRYEDELLNIGRAMNLATGVFTAPVNGRYHFSFKAETGGNTGHFQLRLNEIAIGISYAPSLYGNLPLVATLNLKKGDRFDAFLFSGSLYDDSYRYTQFSGFLLDEDLVLF